MPPREPFKFLDAYTKEDAEIFFGRETEIEELYNRVFSTNHLLIYGQSGTGKTSLIQCGLANRFEESDWLPIFIRYGENIFASLEREMAKLAMTPVPSAHPLDKTLQSLYLDYFKPIYLIFDQFEELFIFGSAEERQRLAQALASLENAPVELKILFVIREEYLAELTELEQYLPALFRNRLRVERLGHAELLRVIEGPCEVCGIGIEAGLAERILERLGLGRAGTMELTYLQVLLDKLYARTKVRSEGRSAAKSRPVRSEGRNRVEPREDETALRCAACLTTNDLEALGTIGDILGAFLDEQLAAMEKEETSLGEAVLKTLITPDGTKKTMGRKEIVSALVSMGQPADPDWVTAVLTRFVTVRVLSEKEESGHYELRHDSLAQKIFERMTALEKDLLEVMQTIENRYKEYQTRGTFLDQAALEYVAPYESRLRFKPHIAEFIGASQREFTKTRRKRMIALFASLITVCIVVSGLGILSYLKYREANRLYYEVNSLYRRTDVLYKKSEEHRKRAEEQTEIAQEHLQQSKLNEIEVLNQTSKLLSLTYDQLGALLASVKAGIKTKQTNVPPTLKFETIFNLRKLVDGIHEKNRVEGHEFPVFSVTFSPDGKRLAWGSADGTITLWDVLDGREIFTLQGHLGFVKSVAFSPDSTMLASGGFDRTIKLWQVADGLELSTLRGHDSRVNSVAFSPDGTLLASGGQDNTIKLWKTSDASELSTFPAHSSGVASVAFSPDGTLLASGGQDNTIKLWKTSDASELNTLPGHSDTVASVVFSPDGTVLASGSWDKSIKLWNVTDGQNLATLHGHTEAVENVTFSPDGTRLASGSVDKTIKLWNLSEKKELATLHGHTEAVESVSFSPNGSRLVSGSQDKTVRFWKIAEEQKIPTLHGHTDEVHSVTFSPDGARLASGSMDGTIKLWNVADGRELTTLQGHTFGVHRVMFSPDGKLLASGSWDSTIKLWNVAGRQELTTLKGHIGRIWGIAFSPDGTQLASGSDDTTIKLWNVTDSRERAILKGHGSGVYSVAFSPDGVLLASGSDRGPIKLWSVADGQELVTLHGHSYNVDSVSFSLNGTLLASGSHDSTIKLWNVADGRELATLQGHSHTVESVTFSPDGTLLASGSWDKTIKLWNVADGQEFVTLHGHTSRIHSVAFSPDGTLLASGSDDRTIKLWHLDLEYYLGRGCEWLHEYLTTNPNVSKVDRRMCDEILGRVSNVN